jgi:hypothetical protein
MEVVFSAEPVFIRRALWAAPFLPVAMGKRSYRVVFQGGTQRSKVTPASKFFIGSWTSGCIPLCGDAMKGNIVSAWAHDTLLTRYDSSWSALLTGFLN